MRNHFLAAALAVSAALSAQPVAAAPIRPFSVVALQSAQRAGLPILVDVHADWCPTCRAQDPIIANIARSPVFARLVIFRLDFDTQTAERRSLRVAKQSTLIVYRGKIERGRSTGITDPVQIRALAASALK